MFQHPRASNYKLSHAQVSYTEQLTDYLIHKRKYLAILISLIVAIILGILVWSHYQEKKNTIAQREMYQATYEFEAGNFEKALTGDESHTGFLDIIQNYRFTKAANLSHLYAGISYLHQAKYTDAIAHLTQFKSTDYLLQARAWGLLGDIYSEQQDYTQASHFYLKAADYKPNEFFTPIYLAKAAVVYEAHRKYQAACQCYERIAKAYPKSPWYDAACKHISRLKTLE
jgi:tetratricopeptide (TPR) repeat protein